MLEYKAKALGYIKDFPENESKKALISLLEYSISRTK